MDRRMEPSPAIGTRIVMQSVKISWSSYDTRLPSGLVGFAQNVLDFREICRDNDGLIQPVPG